MVYVPHGFGTESFRLIFGFDPFDSALGQQLAVEFLQVHCGQFFNGDVTDVRLDVVIDVAFTTVIV